MNDQLQPEHQNSESNGLGLAGFIVSLLGFVGTCGLLSPIGLIMSLIALRKQPKGFAIAGVVLGALGVLWFFLAIFFFGAVILAMLGLGLMAAVLMATTQIGENAFTLYGDIEAYYEANGNAPTALTVMGTYTPDQLTDNWGVPIRYEVSADGQEIWLRSDGEDMTQGTGDDMVFYRNFQTDDFRFEADGIDIGG
jgi:hypothetical protein